MLIMTLAYAQRANDNAYLTQHYKILNQWTQYLISEALIPANQISTDDFAGPLASEVYPIQLNKPMLTGLQPETKPISHSKASSGSKQCP